MTNTTWEIETEQTFEQGFLFDAWRSARLQETPARFHAVRTIGPAGKILTVSGGLPTDEQLAELFRCMDMKPELLVQLDQGDPTYLSWKESPG